MAEKCGDCRFWVDLHDAWAGKGQCRRYPPSVNHRDRDSDHSWPETTAEKWCGEFLPEPPSNGANHG
jgi:hypothetical protein